MLSLLVDWVRKNLVFLFLLVFVLFAYLWTVAPGYTWKHFGFDAGDLLSALALGGVPHPPGFPLYLLLGKVWVTIFPFADLAYRMNLFSLLLGVATAVLVYHAVFRLTGLKTVALLSGLVLAFSKTFWSQSIISEVLTLNSFFFAIIIYLVLRFEEKPSHLLFFALFFLSGLSLSNHPTAVFLLFGLLVFLVVGFLRRQFRFERRFFFALPLFFLGLLPYLYIPFSAAVQKTLLWGDPSTPERLFRYLTLQEFQSLFLLPTDWIDAFLKGMGVLVSDLTFLGFALSALGVYSLWRRRRLFALFLLASFIPHFLFNLSYLIDNIVTFYLPLFVIAAIFLGAGSRVSWEWFRMGIGRMGKRVRELVVFAAEDGRLRVSLGQLLYVSWVSFFFLLPLFLLTVNFTRVTLSGDNEAQAYFAGTLSAIDLSTPIASKKILIPEGEEFTFALRYLRYVLYPEREDLLLLEHNGLYDNAFNLEFFKRKYPQLVFPDHPTGVSVLENTRGLLKFLSANLERYPIFYTHDYPPPGWNSAIRFPLEQGILLSSIGPIYRVGTWSP